MSMPGYPWRPQTQRRNAVGVPPPIASLPRRRDELRGDYAADAENYRHGDPQLHDTNMTMLGTTKREVPHFYAERQINLSLAIESLKTFNANLDPDHSNDLSVAVLWAIIKALRGEPHFNGHLTSSGYLPSAAVHVGVTVPSAANTVVAPTLQDADQMTLPQLSHQVRDLSRRARSGLLRHEHHQIATVTVDRQGLHGADLLYGIVTPPQVAMVCMGRVVDRPWVVAGEVVPCKSLTVSLAGDSRVSEGQDGARFLECVDLVLQQPIGAD